MEELPNISYNFTTEYERLSKQFSTTELRTLIKDILREEREIRKNERFGLYKSIARTAILVTGAVTYSTTTVTADQSKSKLTIGNHSIENTTTIMPKKSSNMTYNERVKNFHEQVEKSLDIKTQVIGSVVNYPLGGYKLTKAHKERLDSFVDQLPKDNVKLQIVGHTDAVGSWEDNKLLGKQRAKAVAKYLASKGVIVTHTISKGYLNPLKTTAEATWVNRRVDIIVRYIEHDKINIKLPSLRYGVDKPVAKTKKVTPSLLHSAYGPEEVHIPKEVNLPKLPKLDKTHNVIKESHLGMEVEHYVPKSEDTVLKKIGQNKDGAVLFYDGDDTLVIKHPIPTSEIVK